jgi:hypothetical protein
MCSKSVRKHLARQGHGLQLRYPYILAVGLLLKHNAKTSAGTRILGICRFWGSADTVNFFGR